MYVFKLKFKFVLLNLNDLKILIIPFNCYYFVCFRVGHLSITFHKNLLFYIFIRKAEMIIFGNLAKQNIRPYT